MLTDIGALSTGVERPGPETGDPRASSVEVENASTCTFSKRRSGGFVRLFYQRICVGHHIRSLCRNSQIIFVSPVLDHVTENLID
jgi:hypothetical protein